MCSWEAKLLTHHQLNLVGLFTAGQLHGITNSTWAVCTAGQLHEIARATHWTLRSYMCYAVTRLLKYCWSTQPTPPGPDMPHSSSTLKRWGSWASHRDSPRLKSSSPKTATVLMINFSPAAGSCWKLRPTWPLSLSRSRPFGHIPHPLSPVGWHLTILTLPESLTWSTELSCEDLSQEDRWMEETIPFTLVFCCSPHNTGQQRLGEIKTSGGFGKVWALMLLTALTASERPVLQHSQHEQLTFWKLHFKLLLAWFCCT